MSEHVCGLTGFNPMIDPPCPGCEADRAVYPEAPPEALTPPKGTWKRCGESAWFACPSCGEYGMLADHRIHRDGRVWPSVLCPVGCGFHRVIQLQGWGEHE